MTRKGAQIELLPQEYKLLEYLLRNAGEHVVTRTPCRRLRVKMIHLDQQLLVVEAVCAAVCSEVGSRGERRRVHPATIRSAPGVSFVDELQRFKIAKESSQLAALLIALFAASALLLGVTAYWIADRAMI